MADENEAPPLELPDVPIVYAWCAGLFGVGPDPDEVWVAMCDDGEVLVTHVSSSRRYGPSDVHLEFASRRALYEAKFGGLTEGHYRFVVLPEGEKPPPQAWAANRRWARKRNDPADPSTS